MRSPYKTNSVIAVRSKTNYFVREDNTRKELLRTSFSGNTKIGGLNSGQYWHYQLEGLTLRITDGLNINGQNSWIPKAIIITCQSKCENGYRAMFCGLMSCNVASCYKSNNTIFASAPLLFNKLLEITSVNRITDLEYDIMVKEVQNNKYVATNINKLFLSNKSAENHPILERFHVYLSQPAYDDNKAAIVCIYNKYQYDISGKNQYMLDYREHMNNMISTVEYAERGQFNSLKYDHQKEGWIRMGGIKISLQAIKFVYKVVVVLLLIVLVIAPIILSKKWHKL